MASPFEALLARDARKIESALAALLKSRDYPPRLRDAMLHAVAGPAKRLRPFLLMESARLFGSVDEASLPAALALECIHCYSLVHDDLPSMDDDDMRRGRAAVHIAYDEATAILAGDALLTLAFEILSGAREIKPELQLQLLSELAEAGAAMVGGQMLDLHAEGRFEAAKKPLLLDERQICDLQSRKTGALIGYAVRAGALLGGASEKQMAQLTAYGETLGLLYQLADDLIDATGTPDRAGKAVAKDACAGKATLVSLSGVDAAQAKLGDLVARTQKRLEDFHGAENLRALPAYLAARISGQP